MMKLAALALCVALVSGASVSRRTLPKPTAFNSVSIGSSDVLIGMYWDPNTSGATDLDAVLYDVADSCNVATKGSANGICLSDTGDARLGSLNARYTINTAPTYVYFDEYSGPSQPFDSTSSTTGYAGMEPIRIQSMTGVFKYVVYDDSTSANLNKGSTLGLNVVVYAGSSTAAATYTLPSSSCAGRFWNVFTINITSSSPLTYSITSTNTVTNSPLTTWGTTTTQDFEKKSRPTC